MNRLAQKIKEARVKAGLSEKDLAKRAGIQLNYLLQVESGKKVVNEQVANQILSVLGTQEAFIDPTELKPKETKTKPVQEKKHTAPVHPNSEWSSVLAGVIHKYPIIGENSGKIIDHREYPILNKTIDGIHFDKLMLIQVEKSDLPAFRILKGDVLSLIKGSALDANAVYYFEYQKQKQIAFLRQESDHYVSVMKSVNDSAPVKVKLNEIVIFGKCIKVEFFV